MPRKEAPQQTGESDGEYRRRQETNRRNRERTAAAKAAASLSGTESSQTNMMAVVPSASVGVQQPPALVAAAAAASHDSMMAVVPQSFPAESYASPQKTGIDLGLALFQSKTKGEVDRSDVKDFCGLGTSALAANAAAHRATEQKHLIDVERAKAVRIDSERRLVDSKSRLADSVGKLNKDQCRAYSSRGFQFNDDDDRMAVVPQPPALTAANRGSVTELKDVVKEIVKEVIKDFNKDIIKEVVEETMDSILDVVKDAIKDAVKDAVRNETSSKAEELKMKILEQNENGMLESGELLAWTTMTEAYAPAEQEKYKYKQEQEKTKQAEYNAARAEYSATQAEYLAARAETLSNGVTAEDLEMKILEHRENGTIDSGEVHDFTRLAEANASAEQAKYKAKYMEKLAVVEKEKTKQEGYKAEQEKAKAAQAEAAAKIAQAMAGQTARRHSI